METREDTPHSTTDKADHPPIDFFISHTAVDKPWVTLLADQLLNQGRSVFLDEARLDPGEQFVAALETALTRSRVLVLILTQAALESKWVNHESRSFLASLYSDRPGYNERIVSVLLEELELPYFLRPLLVVDATQYSSEAYSPTEHIRVGYQRAVRVANALLATPSHTLMKPMVDPLPQPPDGTLLPESSEPNPFLSEVIPVASLWALIAGLPKPRPFHFLFDRKLPLPLFFFFLVLLVSILGILCGAGRIVVTLVQKSPDGPTHTLRFGALDEPDGSFFYLVGVPLLMYSITYFLSHAHNVCDWLYRQGQLTAFQDGKPASPFQMIRMLNDRWFRPSLLLGLLSGLASLVALSEWKDYHHLAFGTFQAPFIKGYEGMRLVDINKELGNIPDLPHPEEWAISHVEGGASSPIRKAFFYPFIILALTLQAFLLTFAVWATLKIIVVLRFFQRSLMRSGSNGVFLDADPRAPDRRYGLTYLWHLYVPVAWFMFIACCGFLLNTIGNAAKGSGRLYNPAESPSWLGLVKQYMYYLIPLLVFLWLIYLASANSIRLSELADRTARSISTQIGKCTSSSRRSNLIRWLQLVKSQRAWPEGQAVGLILVLAFVVFSSVRVASAYPQVSMNLVSAWETSVDVLYTLFPRLK